MANLKSSFLYMFLSLTVICVVSGAILASVNQLTQEPIQISKKAKLENAIREVVPEFDNSPTEDSYLIPTSNNDSLRVYPAKKGDELLGVAIESHTMNGFSGEINILVGLTPQGEVINYAILQHAETPGLGDKMDPWFKTDKNKQSIIGKNLSNETLKVTKEGGQIDAITAATITSRAFLEAVNSAYKAYIGNTDADSGATSKTDGNSSATSKTNSESSAISKSDGNSSATTKTDADSSAITKPDGESGATKK